MDCRSQEAMARRKRKRKSQGKDEYATQHKWKDEYATLLELVIDEHIYLVNYYGFLFDMAITWKDFVRERLAHVGANAVGIMFGGCLVVLPADVAVKNLGFLRPVGVPRGYSLVTKRGTRVYDLRKDLQKLYHAGWTQACFDKAARDVWLVVGEHGHPKWYNRPLFKFLMLETGVDLGEEEV